MPWWKEPTKDQWYAYIAAWLGWTLDAFDFTIFLLIMVPIAKEFDVPITAVDHRLHHDLVAASGRRHGRGLDGRSHGAQDAADDLHPVVFDLQLHRGLLADLRFLLFFRALLGIGMGAEWPAGAALAMESWPARSRGFMSGILQGSWGLGFALSALAYGFLYEHIGWRGLLWIGILPALVVVWIRFFVKEPEVWAENKRQQTEKKAEVQRAAVHHLQAQHIYNTLTGCLWMGAAFCVYYSIWALFSTYLQKELNWTPLMVATPLFWANIVVFAGIRHVGRRRGQVGQAARPSSCPASSPSS